MKLPTRLVAVKKISSKVARSSFPSEQIERVAHLIIEVEGVINPIILRRTSLETYEVVDGDFEYYAAVRAREISPLKGEMIQAIILEPENEKTLLTQVDLLRKEFNPSVSSGNDSELEFRFANLEKAFQLQLEELRKDIRNFKSSIGEIASKERSIVFNEELIEEIVNKFAEAVRSSASASRSQNKSINELKQNPLVLNLASIDELKTVHNIGPKKALEIVKRRENKKFTSVEELSEINGISMNTIDKNGWRECFMIDDSST